MVSASSALREAPSGFASILRRSKFASFDPKISQIYTTFDGHAHRGNWGLKRPLALRRKTGGYIVVKSVDSNEQQTEWYRAEQEARWLKASSELGKEVDLRHSASWSEYMGERWQKTFDSDYNLEPSHSSPLGPNILEYNDSTGWLTSDTNRIRSAHTSNPAAMKQGQFQRFLSKIRRSRERFRPLMEAEIKKQNSKKPNSSNVFNLSHQGTHLLPAFLRQEAARSFEHRNSHILPSPHHNAGWSYSHTSDLTNKLLHPPVPGRVFPPPFPLKSNAYSTVGVAGLLAKITMGDALHRTTPKLSDQNGHSRPVLFRAKSLLLSDAPRVVGARDASGFKESLFQIDLVEDDKIRSRMSNPFPPGSQSYVAHDDPHGGLKSVASAMSAKSQRRKAQSRLRPGGGQGSNKQHLGHVNSMLSKFQFRTTRAYDL